MARKPSAAARVVGQRIKARRLEKGWSQDELAVQCSIESSNIRSYEAGRAMMNVSSLIRIARALDVKPGVLIDDLDPEMFPEHGNVGRTL